MLKEDNVWICAQLCALPVRRVRWRSKKLKLSMRGVRIPCIVPNMVLRPRLSSIRKNSVDQKGLAGKKAITSVNAINARPVPSTPCNHTQKRQKKTIRICLNNNTLLIPFDTLTWDQESGVKPLTTGFRDYWPTNCANVSSNPLWPWASFYVYKSIYS